MNAMEARTREALHRVADALPVSEHQLDRMEGKLMTLIDTPPTEEPTASTRRRNWAVAAVAALALVLAGVALWRDHRETTPPTTPPTTVSQPLVPPELVGLWQNVPDSRWLWEFTPEGRFGIAESPAVYLRGGALTARITQRAGESYTVFDTDKNCSMQWQIRLVRPEAVDVAVSNDACGEYATTTLSLLRVSPRDPAAPALRSWFPSEVERTLTRVEELEGSWVQPQSNLVLVVGGPKVGGGLGYLLDDDGDGSVRPDHRGVVMVSADGSTTAQPNPAYGERCAPVFTKVTTDTATMTTTSVGDGCFAAGSTQTWLRLN